jgi:NAD+ synthase (glutamine-hydrolysing)
LDDKGQVVHVCPQFVEAVATVETTGALGEEPVVERDETAQIYQVLVVGVRDYVRKSGMQKVLIGLSGGLDSAVVCAIAVEALGAENVWGVTMPGPYSSPGSVEDSKRLAENLGIQCDVIPISYIYGAFLTTLEEQFSGTQSNVAEENIQARTRGNILMALSNKFGGMVLTNSNKSELAIGYCTLYGDMSGGLAVIGDVYKTMVYQVAYYINREKEIIPWATIEKPPSAELRPNQRDDESLPPYEILDGIIQGYLHDQLTIDELVTQGFERKTVEWVTRTIDRNDYKRRQAAPILRVTSPVTGYGRNMPLAAKKGPLWKIDE